jgi:hypothetical protein
MGHQPPRQPKSLAAAIPLTTDAKVDVWRGRFGPGTDSCTATNSVRFNGSNLAYCSRTKALRGRFRKSLSGVQPVEQRLSRLQIERVETFGEAAVDGG